MQAVRTFRTRPRPIKLSYEEKFEKLARIYERRKLRLAVFSHLAGRRVSGGHGVSCRASEDRAGRGDRACHVVALGRARGSVYVRLFSSVSPGQFFRFTICHDFKLEHDFLLSNESFGHWLLREIKVFAVSQLVIIVFVTAFYYFLSVAGNRWWIYATVTYVLLSVVIGRLFPVIIVPLFYKRSPLRNEAVVSPCPGACRARALRRLPRRELRPVQGKRKKADAPALVGVGRSRQILISDTLLSRFSVDEIEAVCAHELGHHVHQHYLRLFARSLPSWHWSPFTWRTSCCRSPVRGSISPTRPTLRLFRYSAWCWPDSPLSSDRFCIGYSRRLETESDEYRRERVERS